MFPKHLNKSAEIGFHALDGEHAELHQVRPKRAPGRVLL
jgi:hypothetical protein